MYYKSTKIKYILKHTKNFSNWHKYTVHIYNTDNEQLKASQPYWTAPDFHVCNLGMTEDELI